MNNKNVLWAVFVLFTVFLFANCGVKRMYQGPEKHKDEIAILIASNPEPLKYDHAKVRSIDGTNVGLAKIIHLLPGHHILSIYYYDGHFQWRSKSDIYINYFFKAGHVYRLKSDTYGLSWRAWIEEIMEDK